MHYIVTGGAGYIGSHMTALLIKNGHDVTIIDNFSNSSQKNLDHLNDLVGKGSYYFVLGDVTCPVSLKTAFELASHKYGKVEGVLHFAGLKAVGESNSYPHKYYLNNVAGTLNLLEAMRNHRVYNLVFSSSATVYGSPDSLPIKENAPLRTSNPYGESKLLCEKMLSDVANREGQWSISLLRYFNPVGAHESGLIGELPNGTPNNLMPYVFDVATGKRDFVSVFGDDYDTKDGTGVRDYIHVQDLVEGHLSALLYNETNRGVHCFNLGTGEGYSVLEMIDKTKEISGQKVPYRIVSRRPGDIGTVYAATIKAEKLLGWTAKRNLQSMIEDQYRWSKRIS